QIPDRAKQHGTQMSIRATNLRRQLSGVRLLRRNVRIGPTAQLLCRLTRRRLTATEGFEKLLRVRLKLLASRTHETLRLSLRQTQLESDVQPQTVSGSSLKLR